MRDFAVSYNGDHADTFFFEPVYMDEEITNYYRVMPNVTSKKKMQFAQKMEKIVRKWSGCGFSPVGGLKVYERSVEVDRQKVNVAQCIDEFLDTVFEEQLNRGLSIKNIDGTIFRSILIEKVREGIALDTQRLFDFGDKSSADPAYDTMDGLFTVHYPALNAAGLLAYTDTSSGSVLNAGDGIAILQSVYDKQPLQLRGLPDPDKEFQVSGSVFTQYQRDIESGGGGDYGLMSMINGIATPTFRGVPIRTKWRWDSIWTELGDSNKHVCELSIRDNKVLAVDLISAKNDLRVWYDEDEEQMKIKAHWKAGANYVHHDLISVGY